MDSAGLGVLTNSYVSHQKNGRKLLLVGVNERVQTLFKVTRLDKLFEIFPTVEGAGRRLAARFKSLFPSGELGKAKYGIPGYNGW